MPLADRLAGMLLTAIAVIFLANGLTPGLSGRAPKIFGLFPLPQRLSRGW